jgi:hypothetical protein
MQPMWREANGQRIVIGCDFWYASVRKVLSSFLAVTSGFTRA